MKILITGATGFVGKNLMPKLIKDGHEILEISIDPQSSKELYGNKIKYYFLNNSNSENLEKAAKEFEPDVVIHLATYHTASDAREDMKKILNANIYFLCQVLDSIKNSNVKCFINTGSFAEYYKGDGLLDPAYLYTASKTAARIFVDYYSKVYDFTYMTIVPYTIYGGPDTSKKIIDLIYDSLDSKEKIPLTSGRQVLDFIHLEDVTDFYIQVLRNMDLIKSASTFHLGSGVGNTLREVAEMFETKTHKVANINWGAKEHRPRDVMYAVANIDLQSNIFSWRPKISLEKGIEMYLQKKMID